MTAADDLVELASALADVGRLVRDAVRRGTTQGDADVVRVEGGDEVFGVDVRAEAEVVAGLAGLWRWPGTAVVEGHDSTLAVGGDVGGGPWRYICDPVDGSRVLLAGKRSAWVLLGAGREAGTLEDLEVGAAVEIPCADAARGTVAWAVRGGPVDARRDDLSDRGRSVPFVLTPREAPGVARSFVSVVRGLHRPRVPLAAWEDAVLGHLDVPVFEDAYLCTGGQLMGLATGADAAVFDPRPLVAGSTGLCAHPYDLAAIVVARSAGVVVEALPPGPLDVPLDTTTDVAWAGYANEHVAAALRPRADLFT